MTDSNWDPNRYNTSDNSKEEQKSLLEIIYGTKVNSDGLNENAVVRALEFKVEQERTKQQFYRLENIAKSIELFKLANKVGVPAHHIAPIFSTGNDFSLPSTEQLQNCQQVRHQNQLSNSRRRPPLNYKFPPVSNSLPPEPISFPSNNVTEARSPSKFDVNTINESNENVMSREETDAHVTPYRRSDEFENEYDSSNDNSNHSHSSRSSNNDTENNANAHNGIGNNRVSHRRNFSVPTSRYASPQSPIGITPIINLAKAENIGQRQKNQDLLLRQNQQQQGISSGGPWRKIGMVGKKHRRTKSGSSFGVIDLNILEPLKQSQELSKSSQPQQQQPQLQQPQPQQPQQQQQQSPLHQSQSQQNALQRSREGIIRRKSPNLNSYDEKTSSEKSSRNPSPVRNPKGMNSVAKLLNNS